MCVLSGASLAQAEACGYRPPAVPEATAAGFALLNSPPIVSDADHARLESAWSEPNFYVVAMAEAGLLVSAGSEPGGCVVPTVPPRTGAADTLTDAEHKG